jgi:hypothetical protein
MVLHNNEKRSHLNAPSKLSQRRPYNAMHTEKLFVEFPVLVRPEQSLSDSRESISLEQFQSFFEGVVDVNLASTTHNPYTSSTIT